jgi:MFS family permease
MPAPRASSHSQQASLVASEKDPHSPQITLGLAANLGQFLLLVLVNAFVGAMVGLERSVTPLLGEQVFGLTSLTITLSFIGVFGLVKALANLGAGTVSDHIGRKKVLIAGWLAALPVPFLLIAAPTWEWVVFANVLLGVNQGLCWSIAVIMKVDLVGPARRGLAMGINEAAGYGALALSAMGAGYLATTYGLRPYPFLPGMVFALAGLLLSVFLVRESQGSARQEAQRFTNLDERAGAPSPVEASSPRWPHERERPPVDHALAQQKSRTFGEIFLLTSWRNRALFSVSQSGFVNNLNDGLAWGLFPLVFAAPGLSVAQVGVLAGIYPGVWSVAQLGTGWLSDRLGRK